MALTVTQLADFQADLGISDDEAVFTDAALNRLYARAGDNYELGVAYALRQLWTNAIRFNDYTAGYTAEKKSQVREGLKEAYDDWMEKAGYGAPPVVAGTIEQDLIEPYSTASEYT